MRVLIIHRQQSFLQKLKEKFISGGWHVHASHNGLDGLLTARHFSFDLVLCGFDLPVVSGTEIVRTIRMLSQNTKTPVFFIQSGNETPQLLNLVSHLEANLIHEKELEIPEQVSWLSSDPL